MVRSEALLPLIGQDGNHGKEGEEEELCDLSFCDQIPVGQTTDEKMSLRRLTRCVVFDLNMRAFTGHMFLMSI